MSKARQTSAAIKYAFEDLAQDIIKVLIIEDNNADYYLARKALQKLSGNNSLTIANASALKDALEVIATTSFDVVVLDLNLPDANGAESVIWVKAALPQNVPVIVFSGAADRTTREEALTHGADYFIAKGDANIFELRAIVKRLIDMQLSPHW